MELVSMEFRALNEKTEIILKDARSKRKEREQKEEYDYFNQMVNDCVAELRAGHVAYCFKRAHVAAIQQQIPCDVTYDGTEFKLMPAEGHNLVCPSCGHETHLAQTTHHCPLCGATMVPAEMLSRVM